MWYLPFTSPPISWQFLRTFWQSQHLWSFSLFASGPNYFAPFSFSTSSKLGWSSMETLPKYVERERASQKWCSGVCIPVRCLICSLPFLQQYDIFDLCSVCHSEKCWIIFCRIAVASSSILQSCSGIFPHICTPV